MYIRLPHSTCISVKVTDFAIKRLRKYDCYGVGLLTRLNVGTVPMNKIDTTGTVPKYKIGENGG